MYFVSLSCKNHFIVLVRWKLQIGTVNVEQNIISYNDEQYLLKAHEPSGLGDLELCVFVLLQHGPGQAQPGLLLAQLRCQVVQHPAQDARDYP